MSGIRAEIAIHAPEGCPVVEITRSTNTSGRSITWAGDESGTVTEEFVLDTDRTASPEEFDGATGEIDEVFSYGETQAVRFERAADDACFCEAIETLGHPIQDIYASNNELVVVFHTPDIDTLQEVLRTVHDDWSGTSIRRLTQSAQDRAGADFVFVDRERLTDRQREVLKTAHEMGYFDHPKQANASEVAESLDITQSTFAEHLAAAQRKLLDSILDT